MKLATFKTVGKDARVGLIVFDGIVDLSLHLRKPPADMIGLIANWPACQAQLEFIVTNQRADLPFDAAILLAPIPRPGKILSIGMRHAADGRESGGGTLEAQLWLARTPAGINSPYGPIQLPDEGKTIDYKGELAFVIGKRCRNVSREHAAQVIFGYCAAIDFSVHDWQLREPQTVYREYPDTRAPFGPWIVTGEELENPHDLGIQCFVNGEKRQDSNTRNLLFDCYDQVRHLSQAMTLEPGDVIMTEPRGYAAARCAPPLWLKPGDVVEVEIERIGAIHNTVVIDDSNVGETEIFTR
jgi:2-keto-4-pentenoate hydratase/2-oxohepta-3-ene-1,7-dioic acid hydratase in catechol pathway